MTLSSEEQSRRNALPQPQPQPQDAVSSASLLDAAPLIEGDAKNASKTRIAEVHTAAANVEQKVLAENNHVLTTGTDVERQRVRLAARVAAEEFLRARIAAVEDEEKRLREFLAHVRAKAEGEHNKFTATA